MHELSFKKIRLIHFELRFCHIYMGLIGVGVYL